MLRNLFFALLVSLLAASGGAAQEWAVKMFNATSHDFKSVAAGAKAEYRFQFKNLYEEDVHVKSVSSSCGCTTPLVVKPDLKTFEVGEIVAEFNTRSFIGHKEAVVTVKFDKPFYAEVQLKILGFIRSDVVFQPGLVDFGTVDVGSAAEKRVMVNYAGRSDWSVLHAKVPSGLETEIVETARGNGQVNYELLVRLNKTVPAGYIQDQILLVTNDAKNREIPLDVEGHIISEITVSPSSLFMGVVQAGQKAQKQLIVRGKRPFKIVDVKCDDASFVIAVDDEARQVHRLPIEFTAGDKQGKIAEQISIETDDGATPTLTAYAQVIGSNQPVVAHPTAGGTKSGGSGRVTSPADDE